MSPARGYLSTTREPRWRSSTRQRAKFVRRSCSWPPLGLRTDLCGGELSQSLSDWIGAHCRAFAYFGGVPAQVVCDNLKSGVTKACFFEPAVNRTYADMAAHYGTAVVPARPYKPRDKAKVEVAVQIAERWIVVSQTHLRHDAPAQSAVLLAHGIERRNPRPPRPAERPGDPASRCQPQGPVQSG